VGAAPCQARVPSACPSEACEPRPPHEPPAAGELIVLTVGLESGILFPPLFLNDGLWMALVTTRMTAPSDGPLFRSQKDESYSRFQHRFCSILPVAPNRNLIPRSVTCGDSRPTAPTVMKPSSSATPSHMPGNERYPRNRRPPGVEHILLQPCSGTQRSPPLQSTTRRLSSSRSRNYPWYPT